MESIYDRLVDMLTDVRCMKKEARRPVGNELWFRLSWIERDIEEAIRFTPEWKENVAE